MKRIKIKIDKNLNFLPQILKENGFNNFEISDDDPDLLITEKIIDESKLFVVVWDKHDVDKIEKFSKERHKYLRGFFIKEEIKGFPNPFIETLKDISKEVSFIKELKIRAEDTKNKKEFIEIGSLVKIGKDRDQLEDIFSKSRFTSLFIDKPMLQMMYRLTTILDEMRPSLEKLRHYKDLIEKVKRNGGLNNKKDFDPMVIKKLQDLKKSAPIKLEPILLTGETGVGKTLIARWIYEKQTEMSGTFQEINSSGLSPTLLESEFFGYVKGAFTDAKTDKPGKALLALGGVLFLDEIGDMPPGIQPRVMKFIEEKTFTPEGWYKAEPFYTPLLVIAATNKNLEEEIKRSNFRKDFYARLRHRVHVPSIEERKGSLNAIIDFILQMINRKDKIRYVSRDALERFKSLKYEENFRGLEKVVREATYRTKDYGLDIIMPEVIEER